MLRDATQFGACYDSRMQTERLNLILRTRDEALADIAAMSADIKAQLSADWLAKLQASAHSDPWVHNFRLVLRETGQSIGSCGFKGRPDNEGVVEIAYGIDPDQQGQGYASEAAAALVGFAFDCDQVRVVRAHTLPQPNASTRVLTKCGFLQCGEVIDPDDGPVWRWEKQRQ